MTECCGVPILGRQFACVHEWERFQREGVVSRWIVLEPSRMAQEGRKPQEGEDMVLGL